MKISIFGLGYVGAVSAACFSNDGHEVIGVDSAHLKVDMINNGIPPIIEPGIDTMIAKAAAGNMLRATTDPQSAVSQSDVSFICVGTPSLPNGDIQTDHVLNVSRDIGSALKTKNKRHVVVFRSTMLPGTVRKIVIPALEEASGKTVGKEIGICYNPEFLREGTAIYDFFHPPKTVIGADDPSNVELISPLYSSLKAPMFVTDIEIAEMVKYVDNVWHALKVGFGNEIGRMSKSLGLDSHRVMDIFCSDTKLNISSTYLKPGFAFGGSCLPKDLRAIIYKAKMLDLNLPIINSILSSNAEHVENALHLIMEKGRKKIGFIGFSFKEDTDDLRESPVVILIERLIGKGYDLKIYDPNVNLARLVGANKDFIVNKIPHMSRLMVQDIDDIYEHSDIIVIGNRSQALSVEKLGPDQIVIDLVRAVDGRTSDSTYSGICW